MSATPPILYQSTLRNVVQPAGRPRPKWLLPPKAPDHFNAYGLEIDMELGLLNFPPAQKNTAFTAAPFLFPAFTPHGSVTGVTTANAILTEYSSPQNTGGGVGRFTGTFNIVPASWDSFDTATVNFPGWIDGPAANDSRPAKPRNVTVRTRYDYFVIDLLGIAAGLLDSGGNPIVTVTSEAKIPTNAKQIFTNAYAGTGATIPFSEVNDLVPAGGAAVGSANYIQTFPTLDNYKLWCAVAAPYLARTAAWDATHPPAWNGTGSATTYGQWIYEDSTLANYAGNIIQRATKFALFQ